MANLKDPNPPNDPQQQQPSTDSISFSDFPEDVQLCILSFLAPSDVASFSISSKRFLSLCCSDRKLWFAMCDRRWGSLTRITQWGAGKIPYRLLYQTLHEWEHLIGFWRRSGGHGTPAAAPHSLSPLVFFEWGPSFVAGSRVSPSNSGTYQVRKAPFLWMGLSSQGEVVNFLHPDCRMDLSADFVNSPDLAFSAGDLIRVNVCFMGKRHLVVEKNRGYASHSFSPERWKNGLRKSSSSASLQGEDGSVSEELVAAGSPPDRLMSEIYQYFANRTSPCGERRQRKREKGRQGRRKWETEHFVKIVNCSPTPSCPLQGLWKGISDDNSLDFYLVGYDDIGGIACRSIGDSLKPFSGYSPVFWTSDTTFTESPFSPEEEYLYESRIHLQPLAVGDHICGSSAEYKVSRILNINSSYDLVIPDLAGTTNPRQVEGRIWQYGNGTFGFGFLRDESIIDLKHIALNGCLLDTVGF